MLGFLVLNILVKYYFVQMAKIVIGNMEKLGYSLCPFDHMASSIKWCRSLTDFVNLYQNLNRNFNLIFVIHLEPYPSKL